MKKLLEGLTELLVRGFFFFLRLLPYLWARALCRALAGLVYRLDAKHRRIGLINLSIAFPDESPAWREGVLRESFRQLGDLAVEISRLGRLDRRQLKERVRYEEGYGLEHYLEARQEGGGILFLTAHVGPWELLPAAHALLGSPLSFLVRPLDLPGLNRWLNRRREACGNEVIPKQSALRKVLKRLQQGRDVGFLIDQNVQEKDGVYAPFFGRPACTSSALAALALKTGAPVVAGFIHPDGRPGYWKIRFHPPLRFSPSGDHDKDLREATARFNHLIEEAIRHSPAHWLWGHRRWRTQPEGNPYAPEGATPNAR
ncbi:MAG TPA: lysophospholipid acyltransferase family protein [Acidobacteriota bacterium]|nr:lysophospholipid acyltransferase family protein [Acidobacteriota bacterium]